MTNRDGWQAVLDCLDRAAAIVAEAGTLTPCGCCGDCGLCQRMQAAMAELEQARADSQAARDCRTGYWDSQEDAA